MDWDFEIIKYYFILFLNGRIIVLKIVVVMILYY